MYYYDIKNEHFTSYIDDERKRQINNLRASQTVAIPEDDLQYESNCILF